MHCEHLLVDNKKMSKSLGNIIDLREVLKRVIKQRPSGICSYLRITGQS